MTGADVWGSFSADPRASESAELRASDADRDHAATVLREAYADGRLSRDEHDARAETVLTTRLLGGFVSILADLAPQTALAPAASVSADLRAQAVDRYRRDLRDARNGWVFVTTLCVTIWGATSVVSGGLLFFWPIFPAIGVGIGYFSTRLHAEQRIEAIEDKLADTRRQRVRRDRGDD